VLPQIADVCDAQAIAKPSVKLHDDVTGGALAGAEASTGAGSLHVEDARLVKGEATR